MGPFVGAFVGTLVGVFVGAFVGNLVGAVVGAFVGDRVGPFVGALVGILVGAFVGAFVTGTVWVGLALDGVGIPNETKMGALFSSFVVGRSVGERVGSGVGDFVGIAIVGLGVVLVLAVGPEAADGASGVVTFADGDGISSTGAAGESVSTYRN